MHGTITTMPAKGYRYTHCKRGHAFTEDNTYWHKGRNGQPSRTCKQCLREGSRRKRGSSLTGPSQRVIQANKRELQRRTGKKQCSRCRKRKPLSDFKSHTKTWDHLFTACRQCEAKRWSETETLERKQRMSARNRDAYFGLALGQYDRMLEDQGGVCAICGQGCATGKRLGVDHHHATGAVRALLCSSCNGALGMMGESPARLRLAADYIEAYG